MNKRIVKFFSILLITLFLVGCKSNNNLIGTWETSGGGHKYTFNEDGTCVQDIETLIYNCTYIYDDKIITINPDRDITSSKLYYTLNGDTLEIEEKYGSWDLKETFYRKSN